MPVPGFSSAETRGSRKTATLLAIAVVAVAAIAFWWGSRSDESPAASNVAAPASAPASEPPSARTPPVEAPPQKIERATAPAQRPEPARKAEAPPPAAAAPQRAQDSPERGRGTATASHRPTLDEANVCSSLSRTDWRCSRVSRQTNAGQLFFYTRVKSAAPMTIEHRWFWNDKLYRAVQLRIQPNERSGFRTYSRTAVGKGEWRVEARTPDGAVLHEESFVVK